MWDETNLKDLIDMGYLIHVDVKKSEVTIDKINKRVTFYLYFFWWKKVFVDRESLIKQLERAVGERGYKVEVNFMSYDSPS